jgi:hypothetical protein
MSEQRAKHGPAIRVRPETHETLKELASREQVSLTQLVERMTKDEWRRVRLQECNEAFARLRRNPAAWSAYQEDRQELEATIGDGLYEWDRSHTDEEPWEFEGAAG